MHGLSVKCRVIKPRQRQGLKAIDNEFLDKAIKEMRDRRQARFIANFIGSIARESDCGSIILARSKDGKEKILVVPSVGLRQKDGPVPLCYCHALGSRPKLPRTDAALAKWCMGFSEQLDLLSKLSLFTVGPFDPGGNFRKKIAAELWHAVHDPLLDELLQTK